jgi:hypothetical protein
MHCFGALFRWRTIKVQNECRHDVAAGRERVSVDARPSLVRPLVAGCTII